MTNFIKHKDNKIINLDFILLSEKYTDIELQHYRIRFHVASYGYFIDWYFDTEKERDEVYNKIMKLYVKDLKDE